MAQWYAHVGGQQYGPVNESTLREWLANGRVGPDDLVWTQGMSEWSRSADVSRLQLPPLPEVGQTAGVPSTEGVRGQTPNAELTRSARQALSGQWGGAIGFMVLVTLIGVGAGIIPIIGGIISFLLAGPLRVGEATFFLALTRRRDPQIGMIGSGFHAFGGALAAYFLMGIFVLLWGLLLIVPGVIAAYAYSQTYYILAEYPETDALEAIRRSKELMKGYKAKLCYLHLRFLGWALLCILTLGIGFLFLLPYWQAAVAEFYRDVRGEPV